MNSLVLIPRRTGVRYAQVMVGAAHAADDGAVTTAGPCGTTASVGDIGVVLAADHADRPIDVLTIRATYGGLAFPAPVIVDAVNQARLRELAAQAPLAVANTNGLIEDARAVFPQIP